MLTLYRRHKKGCPHKSRAYRRCKCPLWVDGRLGAEEIRRAMGLTDWQRAQDKVREWEAENKRASQVQPPTIEEATERFLADAEARRLHESTVYKYKLLFGQLKAFCKEQGLTLLAQLDVDRLSAFRAKWTDGPRSSLKKLERLRAFLRFAEKRRWIDSNPASDLKPPKVALRPTMPFTQDEMLRVLGALNTYAEKAAHNGKDNARRLRALVLLLRYSGLRIGDAVGLTAGRITGNKLFLYTAKTGTPVYCVLPDFVVQTLEATPKMTPRYFFWNGVGKLSTAVKVWENRLRRLFDLAKLPDGHAHRFRDTFAVELLLAGVPMERVSILLGHHSVRITERHYAPWVRSRQEQLEADLLRVWSRDAVVLLETKGTPEVHGENERPN